MAPDFLSPLHKATRQLAMHLEDRADDVGVSVTEGHLLTYLDRYAPAPIGELVRVFGIKQSTFTSMLDRLEEDGLVRREVNPEDRRSFLIDVTGDGRALARRLRGHLEDLEDEIRGRVSPRDEEGFHAVMEAVEAITGQRVRRA